MLLETEAPVREKVNPILKLVLEMGPLALFFVANVKPALFNPLVERFMAPALFEGPNGNVFTATAVFIPATIVALVAGLILTRRIPIMPLVSGIFVIVFGALTLWLQNDMFIKMKPTIVNTLFGAILLGGLAMGRPLIRYVLDAAFDLQPEGWRKLTLNWGLFFLFLAVLNEVVWRNFSSEFWGGFKLFGTMPITLIFTITQVPILLKYEVKQQGASAEKDKA
ncbi:putative intracellular septation protein A [Labrys miyagiensis]